MDSTSAESCCSAVGTTLTDEPMAQQPDVNSESPNEVAAYVIHQHILDLQVWLSVDWGANNLCV